jgi:hypothetical protein
MIMRKGPSSVLHLLSRHILLGVAVLLLMVFSTASTLATPMLVSAGAAAASQPTTASTTPLPASLSASTYGTGLSGAPVVLDEVTLTTMAGSLTRSAFDALIEQYFVPLSIHLVFLDVGWNNGANTTSGMVSGGYKQWVADWLAASQQYNVQNILFVKQFGYYFSSPSWDQDFLNAYPGAATVNSNGTYVPLVSCSGCTTASGWTIASPDVYRQYESDLKQLIGWYGQYTSWIGIGEGATGDRNFYGNLGTSIKTSRPFDNFTVSVFAHSVFFTRNINSQGNYIADNSPSKIWGMFINDRPDIGASSGTALVFPATWNVFSGPTILQRFYVPFGTTLSGYTLKAYLGTVGSPSSALSETIYRDNSSTLNGRPVLAAPIESRSVSGITTTQGWASTTFTTTLEGGDYYWVGFSSAGGDASDYYTVGYVGQNVLSDIYPFLGINGVDSATRAAGGSVLWIQDASGNNVTVYPYFNEGLNQASNQPVYFQVNSAIKANMVTFFTSDRAYDPNNITISLQDPNGNTLATGVLSLLALHGDEGLSYAPVNLNATVALQPNTRYRFVFSALPNSDSFAGSLGGGVAQDFITQTADPPSAGYLGQASWPIFSIGLMNLEPQGISNHNYVSATDLFSSPGYRPGSEIALRFMASSPETIQKFEVEAIKVASTAGILNVTLRADNQTAGSHPASLRYTRALAYGTVSLASVNSTFTSCPSVTGQCAWASVMFNGNTNLVGGRYYWLVLSVPDGESIQLQRLVNPYKAPVFYSVDDFSSTWGAPPDGPSDLSFQIVTSGETIKNLVVGQLQYLLGYMAQSFQSPTPFQLKGVWTYVSTSSVSSINVSIHADSGRDTPADNALTWGMIPRNASGNSENYASLNHPLNITSNTKYWLVVTGLCSAAGTCSSPAKAYAILYRADGSASDYGGTSLHYETSSDGVNWTNPTPEGDMNFILAASTSPIKTYNTKALSAEIVAHDATSTTQYPLAGWNSFLDSIQANLMVKLVNLMTTFTGRQADWYTGMPVNLAQSAVGFTPSNVIYADSGAGGIFACSPTQKSCGGNPTFWLDDAKDKVTNILSSPYQPNWLPWSSFGSTNDNRGGLTPADIRTEYLTGIPLTARNPVTFNDWVPDASLHGLSNLTQTTYARSFGDLLNRMQYNGGYYGTASNQLRVLWIGSSDDGLFPQFLTPAVNMTFVSSNYPDQNLTTLGDLTQFNVVVGGLQNPTPSFVARLDSFVSNGGGYVDTSFASYAGEANGFLGLQASSTPASTGGSLTIVRPNKITSPYTSLYYDPYWLRYTTSNMTGQAQPAQVLLRDSSNNPLITTHAYGKGIGVSVEQPYARLSFSGNSQTFYGTQYGSPRDSFVSLLINAIYYAAHKGSMLPILWETNYNQQQPWSPYLQFSVDGSPGKPLLWLSSNDTSASTFDIHLNASFYGISTTHWFALDVQNMSIIASGTGSDIHIRTTVPPKSWLPIYIMSDASNLQPLYATANVLTSSQSGGFTNYVIQGAHDSSTWLVLKSSAPILSVLESGNSSTMLQPYPSLQSLNASRIGYYCSSIASGGTCSSFTSYDQQGWFYDSVLSLLYLHFKTGSPVTISVSQSSTSTTTSSTTSSSSSGSTTSTSSTTSITSTTTSSTTSTLIPSNSPTGLDGTGSATLATGTVTASLRLTTTSPNDVIIVQDAVGAGGTDCTGKDTISDSANLVWTYRAHAFASGNQVEEWYAVASGVLSSDTITTSFCTYEYGAVVAFGIAGANTASPFDPNPSLPRVASGAGDNSITISTTSPNTMILGVMSNLGGQGISDPASFTDVYGNVIHWTSKDFDYRVVSSPQSNYAVTWGNTQNNAWVGLVDAVYGNTAGVSSQAFEAILGAEKAANAALAAVFASLFATSDAGNLVLSRLISVVARSLRQRLSWERHSISLLLNFGKPF